MNIDAACMIGHLADNSKFGFRLGWKSKDTVENGEYQANFVDCYIFHSFEINSIKVFVVPISCK